MKRRLFFTLFLLLTGSNPTWANPIPPCDLAEAVAEYQLSVTDLTKLQSKVNQLYTYPDGTHPQQPLHDEEICQLIKADTIRLIDPAKIKNKPAEPKQDIIAKPIEGALYYIGIKRFTKDTADALKPFLTSQAFQSAQGIVIDLRGNPGGTLYGVIKVAKLLSPANLVMGQTKGTMTDTYVTDKTPSPFELNKPTVVVVDNKTASGAELFAAFIQNHHLATIVGEKTAGAGLVRTVVRINQTTIMTIPVSYLFDSDGKAIEGNGVEPDIMTSQTNCLESYQQGLCKAVIQQALTIQ